MDFLHEKFVSGRGALTCASGGDQLRLVACTVAFGGEGCHGDRVGCLSLQICDDHFL